MEKDLILEIDQLVRSAEAACGKQNWPEMAFYLGVIAGRTDAYIKTNAAPFRKPHVVETA